MKSHHFGKRFHLIFLYIIGFNNIYGDRRPPQGKTRMQWMDNMEEWTVMPFEDLLKKTRNRRKWSRLVHEAANPRMVEDKTRRPPHDLSPIPKSEGRDPQPQD